MGKHDGRDDVDGGRAWSIARPEPAATSSQQAVALVAVFLAVFFGLSFYFLSQPFLADGDSYYHLGIARELNQHGVIHDLPWARFSVLRDGFGDKELLFHLVLAGLIAPGEAEEMGRLALAFFNALLIVMLAWLGMRAVGWWGMAVPAFVYLGSLPFADRVCRLRPELMAVLLVLAIVWLSARRRRVLLAFASALFALSYTAWHVVALLAVLFAMADRVAERRLDWKTPAATIGGLASGLVLHPHFPHNLVVWWYQNVLFFIHKSGLDVGTEIHPPALTDTALYHLPVVLSLVIYWLCTRPETDVGSPRPARYFLIAATLFAFLFSTMARMVTWLIPLAVLAVIFRRRVVVHRRALTVGLAAMLVLAAAQTVLVFRQGVGADNTLEATGAACGRAIPDGAKVAADWRMGTLLVFFAPQGRYLNVLDPTFMAARYPREHAISEELWAGEAVDVPASLRALDSDFVIFIPSADRQLLQARIDHDPRFTLLFTPGAILAAVRPEGTREFVRSWRISPTDPTTPEAQWPLFSWADGARVRDVEAYVDLSNVGSAEVCTTVATELPVREGKIEIAPFGPTEVRLDGSLVAMSDQTIGAVIGNGLLIPLHLAEGAHWLSVTTCRSGSDRGFFALMR